MDFFTWCAITAGFAMAIGAFGASIGQGLAIKGAVESIGRNPAAAPKILTSMLIGLAMIESLAIYVFCVAIILLFANPFVDKVMEIYSK